MKNIRCIFQFGITLLALFLSAGCGKTAGPTTVPQSDAPQIQVAQSIQTSMTLEPHDFAAVVKIISPSKSSYCSGTFITAHTVLTAAHCTLEGGAYTIIASFGTFTTSKKNVLGSGSVNDANDIALLTLDQDAATPDQIIAIGNEVHENEEIYLVGYGCDNFDTRTGGETKREGTNRVSQISNFLEFVTHLPATTHSIISPTDQAATCFGDSGGAGIKKNTDGTYALVGVIHAGGKVGGDLLSQLVDLTRTDNNAFVNQKAI